MIDMTTVWNVQMGEGDWVAAAGDLQSGDDLQTAVLISFFTDRRALASNVIPGGSTDLRGWWGDAGAAYRIGSRLWLLRRAKQVPATLATAKGYCLEALQWLIDDDVAASVEVVCSFPALGMLGIATSLYQQDGSVLATYQWAWMGLS